jgi:hypothetical protein
MDIRQHFLTLAAGDRIPLDAGGGSLRSIMSFLPFLIYAGHVVLNEGDMRSKAEGRLDHLLGAGDSIDEAGVASLWLLSREEWVAIRVIVLQKLLRLRVKAPGDDLWATKGVKDAFLFFMLIDRMQQMIKRESGVAPTFKEGGGLAVVSHQNAQWIADFMKRAVQDGRELAREFEELATRAETEWLTVDSLRDAVRFADIGAVEPDEWVRAALQ